MLEALFVNLIVAGFAAGGLFLLWMGLNALRMLLFSPFWPQVQATVRGKVEIRKSQHYLKNARDYQHTAHSAISHDGQGGGTVTQKNYQPVLQLSYTFKERKYQANNQDFWNHRSGYSRQEAEQMVTKTSKTPLSIRVNPAQPKEVFLDPGHFPWILAPINLLVGGLIATGAVGSLLDSLATVLRLQLPLIAGRSPWVLAVPIAALIYLVGLGLYSLLGRPAAHLKSERV